MTSSCPTTPGSNGYSEEARRSSVESVNTHLSILKIDKTIMEENSSKQRQWIPDADRSVCMNCKEKFTMQRRRHHCRKCGDIFCGECSSHSMPLPEININQNVRVCHKCYAGDANVNDEASVRRIKSQLKDDFNDLVNSTELRETIFCYVKKWIGTKLTDSSSAILDFLNTTIKKEFDLDEPFWDKLKELTLDLDKHVPHVEVRQGAKEGTDWIDYNNDGKVLDKGRLGITFLKNFFGYPNPVNIKTYNFNEFKKIQLQIEEPLRFEEPDMSNIEDKYGELQLQMFKTKKASIISQFRNVGADKRIGTCKISLLEAFRVNNIAQEWPIIGEGETSGQKVGSVNLLFSFKEQRSPTLNEKLTELILDKILSDIKSIQERAGAHAVMNGIIDEVSNEIPVPFTYNYIPQTLTPSVEYFIGISTPEKKKLTNPIDLHYNDKKIGDISSMLKEGSNTLPGCQVPVESFNKDIIEIRKNGGPCLDKIDVRSISWKSGKTTDNIPLHFELRSVLTPSSGNHQFPSTNMARTLLNLLYFDEINKLKNEQNLLEWDGSLRSSANNIISAVRPCCSSKEWSAMVAWTLLDFKLLFPEISSKIIFDNLKILSKLVGDFKSPAEAYGHRLTSTCTAALESYEKCCLENISAFSGINCPETRYKEIEWMINSLGIIHNYQYEEVMEKLETYVSSHVKDNTREINLQNDGNLTRTTALCETYESRLSIIQKKYENFALNFWCPLIVVNVVDNILPTIQAFISQSQSNGSMNTKEVVGIIKNVYFAIKRLLIYGKKSFEKSTDTESNFFQTFQVWVSSSIIALKLEHEPQMIEAVKVQSYHLNTDSPKNKVSRQASITSFSIVNELEGANHVSGIFYGLIKSWTDNFEYYIKKGDFNTEFLNMIHHLFKIYLKELEKVVFSDKYFGPEEYANVMMSIAQVKYQYLDQTFVNEETTTKLQSLRKKMNSDIFTRASGLTDKFCKDQKPYFERYIRGENTSKMKSNFYERKSKGNNLNECVKGLLEFLKEKHDKYIEFCKEHSSGDQTGLFTTMKKKVLQTEEEVIQEYFEKEKHKRKKDKQVMEELFETIRKSIDYRESESSILLNICSELEFENAEPLELISKYLGFVCDAQSHQEENTGVVRYIVGKIGKTIHLQLKSTAGLEPREDRDACNFKIKVLLLPTENKSKECFIKYNTPTYKKATSVLFDLHEEHTDPVSYKFKFDLPEDGGTQNNSKFTQYIELNLYDISSARLWKYYRGHVLIPTNDDKILEYETIGNFEEECQIFEGKFAFTHPVDCIQNSDPLLALSYSVLKERKDELSKEYVSNYREYQIKDCKTKTKYGA